MVESQSYNLEIYHNGQTQWQITAIRLNSGHLNLTISIQAHSECSLCVIKNILDSKDILWSLSNCFRVRSIGKIFPI